MTATAPASTRISNPAFVVPDAMAALQNLGQVAAKAARDAGISPGLTELIHLRASQINGCSVCVDMHWRDARRHGESDERIFSVAAWRETPYYTDAERAAFELTESLTRLADDPEGVPDAVYDAAAAHYDEAALATLILEIVSINVWNRLNASVRQVVGAVSW